MNVGLCVGGPLNGQQLASRYPKGVLLVDKPANACWIYEWNEARAVFVVRDEQPMPVHTEGPVSRYRAAEEPNYDVLAAPWVTSGGEAADGD